MRAHLRYLRYVIRHKWYVLREGQRLGAPLWQLLIHDWTKFLPCEWFPYVRYFYGNVRDETDFNIAWNHHQKANPHHWQYWLLTNDNSDPKTVPLEMPDGYVREMVADWAGAGRAITGKLGVVDWYEKNRDQIMMHPATRRKVEMLLGLYYGKDPC